MKVKQFTETAGSRGGIDTEINNWMYKNKKIEIIDIKYTAYSDEGYYCILALVMYSDK